MLETHPFGDFLPPKIRYLLLGSFTSRTYLTDPKIHDWFYGSPRNQFWRIIEAIYGSELKDTQAKKDLLTSLETGITDIIYQCERSKGNSLDANLINIVYNPNLESIIKEKNIQQLFFTSRYVEGLYRKAFKSLLTDLPELELFTLPSPSPRYAAMTREQKIEKYKSLLPQISS